MKFIEKFTAAFKQAPQMYLSSWTDKLGLANDWNSGRAFNSYRSSVYWCINIRAEAIAKAKHYLYIRKGKDKVELDDHPFYELTDSPNRYGQSWYDIRYITQVFKDLVGNAYWYVPKDKLGRPAEIIVLPPQHVKIIVSQTGVVEGYEYMPNQLKFQVDEIIHHKYPSPKNFYYGMSPLEAASYQSDIDGATSKYMKSYMENDGTPKFALLSKTKINETTYSALVSRFFEAYSGTSNAGLPFIVDGGLDIKSISTSIKEMDYTQTRKDVRDEIMQIFRIPAIVGNVTENVNRSSSIAGMLNFIDNTIDPILEQERQLLSGFIKQKYDKRLFLEYWIERPSDTELLLKENEAGIKYGWKSVNEVRASYGESPVEGGDEIKPWSPNGLETQPTGEIN